MKQLIYLDFNSFLLDSQLVWLGDKEINRINKAGISLAEGARVTFFDDDKDEFGDLNYICEDGVLGFDKNRNSWFASFQIKSDYHLRISDDVVTYR